MSYCTELNYGWSCHWIKWAKTIKNSTCLNLNTCQWGSFLFLLIILIGFGKHVSGMNFIYLMLNGGIENTDLASCLFAEQPAERCQLTGSWTPTPRTTTNWWVTATSSLAVNCFLSHSSPPVCVCSGQAEGGVPQLAAGCRSHQRCFHHEGGTVNS